MGCDGGTIPKRDELVRTKKKNIQYSKEIKYGAKWNHCHLSQLPLQKPIVADLLGNLYNKDKIIEYLLDKAKFENGPSHIKNLKDLKEINLTPNPSFNYNKQENGDKLNTINKSQWICSVTGLEMNGSFKFYYLFSCGCVLSERALKSISNINQKCLKCEKPFDQSDLIIINPNDEDLEINLNKLKTRKDLLAKEKTDKDSNKKPIKKASEAEITKMKRKHDSINIKYCDNMQQTKKIKSIQDDPDASDAYKSLFNTCEKAKNQQKAHWTTYNPLYN